MNKVRGNTVYLTAAARNTLLRVLLNSDLPPETKKYLTKKISGEYITPEIEERWRVIKKKRHDRKDLYKEEIDYDDFC